MDIDISAAGNHVVFRPLCDVCGRPASRIELVPPGALPAASETWTPKDQEAYVRYHDPEKWRLIFEGICAGNGHGDDVSDEKAERYRRAFGTPVSMDNVRSVNLYDDAGYCIPCGVAYCYAHWNVSPSGLGRCPRRHRKSLDPHWSPDWD